MNAASIGTQSHREPGAEDWLGIFGITGNTHDNNFIPVERLPDAVVSVNRTTLTPLKIAASETDKVLFVH